LNQKDEDHSQEIEKKVIDLDALTEEIEVLQEKLKTYEHSSNQQNK
jgi:hypothetical protein